MAERIQPIFLFALPRSGSTLLQRILSAHPHIETSSEPWFLLPLMYSLREDGVASEYAHRMTVEYTTDFWKQVRGGRAAYLDALRELATSMYARASQTPGARYFVDKTPRYALVIPEILETFPNARCVVLLRHPLAVVASNNETFMNGRWYVPNQKALLYTALAELARLVKDHRARVHVVHYRELVKNPEKTLRGVCEYLELPFVDDMLVDGPNIELRGIAGDPTGVHEYDDISEEPLSKWPANLANPLRRRWARRYLRWIGRERLATLGYDLDALLAEVDAMPFSTRYLLSDCVRMPVGWLYGALQLPVLKRSLRALASGSSERSNPLY